MLFFFRTILSFLRDPSYRNLLLASSGVVLLGTVTYHFLEGWEYLDALYFCVITLTTIGYGDFSPQTTGGKIFTIFYILMGLGMILNFINTVYQHYQNQQNKKKDKKDQS